MKHKCIIGRFRQHFSVIETILKCYKLHYLEGASQRTQTTFRFLAPKTMLAPKKLIGLGPLSQSQL